MTNPIPPNLPGSMMQHPVVKLLVQNSSAKTICALSVACRGMNRVLHRPKLELCERKVKEIIQNGNEESLPVLYKALGVITQYRGIEKTLELTKDVRADLHDDLFGSVADELVSRNRVGDAEKILGRMLDKERRDNCLSSLFMYVCKKYGSIDSDQQVSVDTLVERDEIIDIQTILDSIQDRGIRDYFIRNTSFLTSINQRITDLRLVKAAENLLASADFNGALGLISSIHDQKKRNNCLALLCIAALNASNYDDAIGAWEELSPTDEYDQHEFEDDFSHPQLRTYQSALLLVLAFSLHDAGKTAKAKRLINRCRNQVHKRYIYDKVFNG